MMQVIDNSILFKDNKEKDFDHGLCLFNEYKNEEKEEEKKKNEEKKEEEGMKFKMSIVQMHLFLLDDTEKP